MQPETPPAANAPRWQPVGAVDRRVLGVLVEKAKTTPDVYPMSINAICTGANQKNNRAPVMNLDTDDVEASLDRLRALGAVAEVQGSGRVAKYRHYLYDWLGVDKLEMAVMAELLLRGPQTEGELRGRAARMEPIADLSALRPILDGLKAKKLLVALTPEGRGQIITHALYTSGEWDKVKAQSAALGAADLEDEPVPRAAANDGSVHRSATEAPPARVAGAPPQGASDTGIAPLRREMDELRRQLSQLRSEVEELASELSRGKAEVDRLREALGG